MRQVPNGLLAQIIFKNSLLDAVQYLSPKETDDGEIHACIHQAK